MRLCIRCNQMTDNFKTEGRKICIDCRKEYNNNWCKNNKEAMRKSHKKSYAKHKEKRNAASRDWYKNNKDYFKTDKIKDRNKRYSKNNRDKFAVYSKRYRNNNKSKLATYNKKWDKENKDKKTEYSRVRRARTNNAPGSFTDQEFKELCKKYDNRCLCCGEQKKLTADHVIPITWEGSTNYIENIQPLCQSCNSTKSNKSDADYRKGKKA